MNILFPPRECEDSNAPVQIENRILPDKVSFQIPTIGHKRKETTSICTNIKKLSPPITLNPCFDELIQQPWPNPPRYLYALNSHPADWKVKFHDKTHTYFVAWNDKDYSSRWNLSVSGWYKKYLPEFPQQEVIDLIVKKWKREKNTSYKYYGMEAEDIAKQWKSIGDRASYEGTWLHLLFECDCNHTLDKSKYLHLTEFKQYMNWRNNYFDRYFEEFRTELRFHSKENLRLVGTADLISIRKDHGSPELTNGILTLQIFDWKASRKLFEAILEQQTACCSQPNCRYQLCNAPIHQTWKAPCERQECSPGMCPGYEHKTKQYPRKYGTGPLSQFTNHKLTGYVIQQNAYRWFLTTFYNHWVWKNQKYTKVHVEFMKLVVVHRQNPYDEALMIDIPVYEDVIQSMVSLREEELNRLRKEDHEEFQENLTALQEAE